MREDDDRVPKGRDGSPRLLADTALQSVARVAPRTLFDSDKPILFDEWQTAPTLWDSVKEAVDAAGPVKGQYLLTGSATPTDNINRHTGADRIFTMRMRPMSLFESGHSNGQVSLEGLFDGDTPSAFNKDMSILDVIDRIVAGGWPGALGMSVPAKPSGSCGGTWTRSCAKTSRGSARDATSRTCAAC